MLLHTDTYRWRVLRTQLVKNALSVVGRADGPILTPAACMPASLGDDSTMHSCYQLLCYQLYTAYALFVSNYFCKYNPVTNVDILSICLTSSTLLLSFHPYVGVTAYSSGTRSQPSKHAVYTYCSRINARPAKPVKIADFG